MRMSAKQTRARAIYLTYFNNQHEFLEEVPVWDTHGLEEGDTLLCKRPYYENPKEYFAMTLEEIGKQEGVSGSRISEIIAKALRKLKHPKRLGSRDDIIDMCNHLNNIRR